MTEKNELEKDDLRVDPQVEVDDENPCQINFVLDAWFDVDRKFGIKTNGEEGTWLNLWGFYNPFENTLKIKGQISYDDGSSDWFDYDSTSAESELIKDMVAVELQKQYGLTPQEFCNQYIDELDAQQEQGGLR